METDAAKRNKEKKPQQKTGLNTQNGPKSDDFSKTP